MFQKISEIVKRWSHEGMRWPFVHDPVANKPSVTLLMFYLTFTVMLIAIAYSSGMMLAKGDYLSATFMPMLAWGLAYVFYRMRRLDKFKIDLDDKSIEFEGNDEEKKDE